MSVVLVEETISTREAAFQLGVSYSTAHRWVCRWHPPVGAGARMRVTSIDMLVMAAWRAINGQGGYFSIAPQMLRLLCDAAEAAIRCDPQRWLAICPEWCETFPAAEVAAAGWLSLPRPRPACTFIDLELRP